MRHIYRHRKAQQGDSGFTLIELLVSVTLLAIMFAMLSIIFGFIFTQSTNLTNSSISGSKAETSLWTLRVPLRYTVTPYTAATSNAGLPGQTSPCWGTNPAAFYPPMPGLPAYGTYPAIPAVPTAGGAQYGALVSPQDNALLVAHDFDVVFCAQAPYQPSSAVPNVYRLWVNPATCSDHSGDRRRKLHPPTRQLRSF